ncbi:MAG TPA: DUF2237 family protein [Halothiobacillaceae bacterium]|nr:DUF2237 family protein [Halothiobacillaceae bacterium]
MDKNQLNVLGTPLAVCSTRPLTGFYRDGRCHLDADEIGNHGVCAQVDDAFLAFSARRGNELRRPVAAYDFPGLKAGDCWCLCALRWKEAMLAGVAPPVVLAATHHAVLQHIQLTDLLAHAVDAPGGGLDPDYY